MICSVGEDGVLHQLQEIVDGLPVGLVVDPESVLVLVQEAVAVHLAEDPGHVSGIHAHVLGQLQTVAGPVAEAAENFQPLFVADALEHVAHGLHIAAPAPGQTVGGDGTADVEGIVPQLQGGVGRHGGQQIAVHQQHRHTGMVAHFRQEGIIGEAPDEVDQTGFTEGLGPVPLRIRKKLLFPVQGPSQSPRVGFDEIDQLLHAPLEIPEALVHLHLKFRREAHGLDLHEQVAGTAGVVGEGEDHVLPVAGGQPVAPFLEALPDAADLPGIFPQARLSQGAEGVGHDLGQTHALRVIPGAGEVMLHPGIRGVQLRAELLHDGLQAAHLRALGLVIRVAHEKTLTADGGLKGDAIYIFVQHGHRFHQQKGSAHDLISQNQHSSSSHFFQLYRKKAEKSSPQGVFLY